MTRALAAAVVAAALLATGCGSDYADAGKAEQGIEDSLSTATTQVTSASCPDDVTKEEGKTFTCDVKLSGGGKAQVTVTQTSDRNSFQYAFKPGSVELPGATVEKEVEESLANAGAADAQVDCPETVDVVVGETVTCAITGAGGAKGEVTFTFSDASGAVDSSSVETS